MTRKYGGGDEEDRGNQAELVCHSAVTAGARSCPVIVCVRPCGQTCGLRQLLWMSICAVCVWPFPLRPEFVRCGKAYVLEHR